MLPAYDTATEMFVTRTRLHLGPASDFFSGERVELTLGDKTLLANGRPVTFLKNRRCAVQRYIYELRQPLWRVVLSQWGLAAIDVTVYLDVSELGERVRVGSRIPGRQLLYQQVMSAPYPDHRCRHALLAHLVGPDKRKQMERAFSDHLEDVQEMERALLQQTEEVSTTRGLSYETRVDMVERAQRERLNTQLLPFQKRALMEMIRLEVEGTYHTDVSARYHRIATDNHEVWMTVQDTLHLTDECERGAVHFRGGFLTEQMGMGKTLTVLALCAARPVSPSTRRPRATLVVCPAHVTSHWVTQIKTHTQMRCCVIGVKSQLQKFTVGSIMSGQYDVVILSYNIFCNPAFKKAMDYYSVGIPLRADALMHDFSRLTAEQQAAYPFAPHVFDWGRVVVDEFHELGSYMYQQVAQYVAILKAESRWYVSGTPLVYPSLYQVLIPPVTRQAPGLPFHDTLLAWIRKCNIRNRSYEDVSIPKLTERVLWVHLSKAERAIYDSLRHDKNEQLRVCSYARITRVVQEHGEHVGTLDEMKVLVMNQLVASTQSQEEAVATKRGKLAVLESWAPVDGTREAANLRDLRNQLVQDVKKLEQLRATLTYVSHGEQTECVICLEEMQTPCTIKVCGHRICADCVSRAVRTDPRCPVCRVDYTPKDIIRLRPADEDELLTAYGSKFRALIHMLRDTQSVKTLIFSQWDELLRDVGRCINKHHREKVLFCRGNIMQKHASLQKFTCDPTHNLLLLSTLNSGSGCDLSIAKRVILLDTLDGSGTFINAIERQAIARCHRMGQTGSVEVVRIIAKDTIEETSMT